jgi:predicted GNAT superfamily acetyltransferase
MILQAALCDGRHVASVIRSLTRRLSSMESDCVFDEFTPRRLDMSDFAELAALQREVAAGAPQGFIRGKSDDDLAAIVEGRAGAAYGVRARGELIAAGLLTFPGPTPKGAPPFPRVPPTDWSTRVAFFDNAVVRADMRGRGLQRALFDARLAHARRAGRVWFCAGVHAGNIASISNLLKRGMAIVGLAFFHGYPLFAMLRAEDASALATTGAGVHVAAHDVVAHERVLGGGMIGEGIVDGAVVYRRAVKSNAVGQAVVREIA